MLVGIVAGGESEALHVGISAYSWTVSDSSSRTLEFRTESCLHVYLPWERASSQVFRMWADVGLRELHSGYLLHTLKCQRWRLRGVGRQSAPARMRNDS